MGVAAVVLSAACASVQSQTQEPVVTTVDLKSITDAALADATRRTGIEREKLEILEAQAVTWQNGSLGCPQKGMVYTDALVPGYRVRIRAGEQVLDYHASSRGDPTLCPAGRAVDPIPGDSRA